MVDYIYIIDDESGIYVVMKPLILNETYHFKKCDVALFNRNLRVLFMRYLFIQ